MKHGAKLTPESISTNYISNVSLFKRYKEQLYGLTGTLGKAIPFLENVYGVDTMLVPPFREKIHKNIQPIVLQEYSQWTNELVLNNIGKLRSGRGVLLITQYIQDADALRELFIKFDLREKLCKGLDSEKFSWTMGDIDTLNAYNKKCWWLQVQTLPNN